MKITILTILITLVSSQVAFSQKSNSIVPPSAKVFIGPMSDGFDKYLVAALSAKKVPVQIVTAKADAAFEIVGTSESKKAGAAKMIIMGSWHSTEQASITVTNLKTGEVVWGYSVNKADSMHGKRSTAESCAKNLKKKIESGK